MFMMDDTDQKNLSVLLIFFRHLKNIIIKKHLNKIHNQMIFIAGLTILIDNFGSFSFSP